ncbi:MAG: pantothenate synthetase [Rhodomicrobium sp.]|nr:MAG: pantothenate synthetase [Rhodomicrobium sp.]
MQQGLSVISQVQVLRDEIREHRLAGKRIALVPTMGALHEGHLSLVTLARQRADIVICSIFVNPKQFGEGEDLDAYPRTLEADVRLLDEIGTDLVFSPSSDDIYPSGFATKVSVAGVSEGMCGDDRPEHFDGVATIVAKLLLMVLPDVAIFGEKDFQQLLVIKQMVRDLNIPVEILGAPIVRAEDGLALSSRNEYLSAERRAIAPKLYEVLTDLAAEIRNGGEVPRVIEKARGRLIDYGFSVDYVELRSGLHLDRRTALVDGEEARVFAAVRLGATRLIDNVAV